MNSLTDPMSHCLRVVDTLEKKMKEKKGINVEAKRERPRRGWESKSDLLLSEMPQKSRKEWGFGSAVLGHSLNEDFAFSQRERETETETEREEKTQNETHKTNEIYIKLEIKVVNNLSLSSPSLSH